MGIFKFSLAGIFYRFTLPGALRPYKTYIICPNHTSNLDISAMSVLVKNNCCFMGKRGTNRRYCNQPVFQNCRHTG